MASPEQLRRLLEAVMSISSDLKLPIVLRKLIETATGLVNARYGALGVLDEDHTRLVEFITVGLTDQQVQAIGEPPKGHGVLGLLITDAKPVRVDDLSQHPLRHGFPLNHPKMTSFLGVPIHVRGKVFGNIYLTDKRGGSGFSSADEELLVALASASAIAIENARLHDRVGALRVVEERERIARDLHDTVIQRLFATGLALQRVAGSIPEDELRDKLELCVDDLDATVREVRSTIFDLQRRRIPGRSIREEVIGLISEAEGPLGFRPVVRFDGTIDLRVPDELAAGVLAVLREGLSNVARHARAGHVEVSLTARDDRLKVEISDDGVGMPDPEYRRVGGQGLTNMSERADEYGGSCSIEAISSGGTRVLWMVPLPS